jgi:hypothetical protein
MPLPEGRKPLSDKDMINLLRNMAAGLGSRDDVLQNELQQTADRFEELTDFEIESLDPAERSWYYDGDGTKRPKSQEDG